MMNYPNFFQDVPTIKLQDPLSAFLGTFKYGFVEFKYVDIVKSAGHSCPTVMGAYLSTLKALEALYSDEIPQRGNIAIELKDDSANGVTGVIASVITQITGATETTGFKGMNGNFARDNLMQFNADISAPITFKRLDTGKTVQVTYDPSSIKGDPKQQELMGKIMQQKATDDEKKEFGRLWQQRVEAISLAVDQVIKVEEVL